MLGRLVCGLIDFEVREVVRDRLSVGVGDLCECGDVSNDGGVDTADVTALRTFLAGGALSADGLAKCSVIDLASPTCDVADLTVLRRRLETRPLLPGTFPVCVAARP